MRLRLTACAFAASLLVVVLLAGCGVGASVPAEVEPTSFALKIVHHYFPLEEGVLRTYAGEQEGAELVEEVRVLEQRRSILGVACTGLEEQRFFDGVLDSVTTEWFAQDRLGNVWKFGEEAWEDDGAAFTLSADSWVASRGGRRAWLAFGVAPQVGDRYVEPRPPGTAVHEIASITREVTVPVGTFEGCIEVVENPDDPLDSDIILYAPAVGRVAQSDPQGSSHLVSVQPR